MMKDDVVTRLAALKVNGAPRSATALVRELFDQIEEALKRAKVSDVVAELNQAGVDVQLSGFRTAYARVKKERSSGKQVTKLSQQRTKGILICPHCSLTLTMDGRPFVDKLTVNSLVSSQAVTGTMSPSVNEATPIARLSDAYVPPAIGSVRKHFVPR